MDASPANLHRAKDGSSRRLPLWTMLTGILLATSSCAAVAADYVQVPAGTLVSILANGANNTPIAVPAFAMRVMPVSKREFRDFVASHPQWQRGSIADTFADSAYLQDWQAPLALGDVSSEEQPVVNVSWFAAEAFCENEGARLPTWSEWEYVAAADATRRDARADPLWLARILSWYATSSRAEIASVGGAANVYGVRDMHGLIWEWVDDFNALLVDPDSRSGDDPDKLKFCGAGAINLQDRQNYAVLMRIALLSSLNAADSTASLGFRCVRPHLKDAR